MPSGYGHVTSGNLVDPLGPVQQPHIRSFLGGEKSNDPILNTLMVTSMIVGLFVLAMEFGRMSIGWTS